MNKKKALVLAACALLCLHDAGAEGSESAAVERNVFIPMRDGVRLATDLYLPATSRSQRLPVVLIRTPYSKDLSYANAYGDPQSILRFFTQHGYVVVVQDKRGRFNSEGLYVASGGDARDGYDTVEWLAKQQWSNGRIGTYGCSYEGDVQIFMAQEKHPALKAMIPQASGSAVGSLGGHYRYFGSRIGGAVEWAQSIGWFSRSGEKIFPRLPADLPTDVYNASAQRWDRTRRMPPIDFWKAAWHLPMRQALAAQGHLATDFEDNVARTPTDPYWTALPYMTPDYTSDVPTLFINSWYDFGADMTLLQFNHFRNRSISQQARDHQFAIISPHTHCEFERGAAAQTLVGDLPVGDTRFDYRSAYLTWFDAWLKEDAAARTVIRSWPRLRYFAIGRNRWQQAEQWPPSTAHEQAFLLDSGGHANSLNGDGVLHTASSPRDRARLDSFVYDPANPVPSRGGAMCCTGTPDARAGALDQRPVEARSDVLVYTSEVLESEIEVTGAPRVDLYVSSDVVDTDFTAKLVDVHPDGRAFNVAEGIIRARYREGQTREVWMRPGEIYAASLPLAAVSNVFLPGHRIRLELSSSNFPRFDRHLNMGGNNADHTTWKVARNSIHHSAQHRSRLILPIIARRAPVQ